MKEILHMPGKQEHGCFKSVLDKKQYTFYVVIYLLDTETVTFP